MLRHLAYTATPFPARSMILIITVLASIYFSVCPSDRDYLNRVMEEIKVRVWTGAAFASAHCLPITRSFPTRSPPSRSRTRRR